AGMTANNAGTPAGDAAVSEGSPDGVAPESQSGGSGAAVETAAAAESDRLDPETRAVIEELGDVDVAETPPVELLSRVQEWQERLE
ncbi:hypothetical protein, partial [Halorubrum sp. AJ67]